MTVETIKSRQKSPEFKTSAQLYANFEILNDKDYNLKNIYVQFDDLSKVESKNATKYDMYAYQDSLHLIPFNNKLKEFQLKYKQIVQAVIPPHFPSMIFLITRFLSHLLYVNFRFQKDTYATRLLDLISKENPQLVSKAVKETHHSKEKDIATNNIDIINQKKLIDVGTSPKKKPIILHRPVRIFIADGTLQPEAEYGNEEKSRRPIRNGSKYTFSDQNSSIDERDSVLPRQLRYQKHRPISVNDSLVDTYRAEELIKFDNNVHTYEKPALKNIGGTTAPTYQQSNSIKSVQSDHNTIQSVRQEKIFALRENVCHDQRCHNYLQERKYTPPINSRELHLPKKNSTDRSVHPVKSEHSRKPNRQRSFHDEDRRTSSHFHGESRHRMNDSRFVTFGRHDNRSDTLSSSSPDLFVKIYRPQD